MDEVERRQVVVVGSGFGGAVAACRLAQAGCDVLVLERGRWYGRGDFPRSATDAWRWQSGGPFDVRFTGGVAVVLAAGVGGGSLLYSNVHLRMPDDGFDDRWPSAFSRAELDPYYDTVSAMLDLTPVGGGCWKEPPRTHAMAEAARLVGAEDDFFRPPLAVNFGDPGVLRTNRFGVGQEGCRHCGKCSVGCNHSAKNSLDKNYLPLALANDAEIRARCEVTHLAAVPGHRYRVTYLDHEAGETREVVACRLVLAAGALGSTELLLRHGPSLSRVDGGLSPRLGERYSANGDVVTLALGIRRAWEPTRGPAITAAIVSRDEHFFLTEDGGIPPLSVLDFGVRSDYADEPCPPPIREAFPTMDNTAILLGMGRDSGTGRVAARGRVEVDWPYAENEPYYRAVSSYHRDLGRALDELTHVDAGLAARVPVSVHSLGGAVMGDDPDRGVVDPYGEVFGAPGVFVFDGAAIPTATGVNPSHTIAAMAERNAEHLARCLSGKRDWQAPERKAARAFVDPLPAG